MNEAQESMEKVLLLHDYYQREVKQLMNPGGMNKPQSIATKITSILTNSKRHGWGIHEDVDAVRESLYRKWADYKDAELSLWYSDLKAIYEDETTLKVNKVINFYIERFSMTEKEKRLYKEFQQKQYM